MIMRAAGAGIAVVMEEKSGIGTLMDARRDRHDVHHHLLWEEAMVIMIMRKRVEGKAAAEEGWEHLRVYWVSSWAVPEDSDPA